MKRLKYLEVFEAFQSIKLSKILGYVNQNSKSDLIERLKKLGKLYDFPISQFSDDMFQYLPYKRALDVNIEKSGENPCQGSSTKFFGDLGIPGEVCKSGRIKRKWGSGTRQVTCPGCEGTGQQKPESSVQIVKFWFTKEGQFVAVTGVDGVLRKSETYTDLIITNSGQLRILKHLQPVLMKTKQSSGFVSGVIYFEGSDIYCIQNVYDGGTPNSPDWRNWGRYSWNVSGGDFSQIKPIAQPSPKEDDSSELDPATWNVPLNNNYEVDSRRDITYEIRDAHFALVLDLNFLKSGGFVKKSEIVSGREEQQSGSKLEWSDEKIRNQNIERWTKTLALKTDIIENISNLQKLVTRSSGDRYLLFLFVNLRLIRKFKDICQEYYSLIESDFDKDQIAERLSKKILELFSITAKKKALVIKNLSNVKLNLTNFSDDEDDQIQPQKLLEIVKILESMSQNFYQKLSKHSYETIEDLEVVILKLQSLDEVLGNSPGFRNAVWNLSSFIENLSEEDSRAYYYLCNYWRVKDNVDSILQGLKRAEIIINKL